MYNTGFELLIELLEWLLLTPYGLLTLSLSMLAGLIIWLICHAGEIIRGFDRAIKIDRRLGI